MEEINSFLDYQKVLGILESIFDAKPDTPEGDELERLAKLISDWEDKNFPLD